MSQYMDMAEHLSHEDCAVQLVLLPVPATMLVSNTVSSALAACYLQNLYLRVWGWIVGWLCKSAVCYDQRVRIRCNFTTSCRGSYRHPMTRPSVCGTGNQGISHPALTVVHLPQCTACGSVEYTVIVSYTHRCSDLRVLTMGWFKQRDCQYTAACGIPWGVLMLS